jgi:hypothetical protein
MAQKLNLFCFTFFVFIALALAQAGPPSGPGCMPGPGAPIPPMKCGNNEKYVHKNNCGNICEISCSNIGEVPEYKSFDEARAASACIEGCYCQPGYIRDENDSCVLQTPNTCGK